MFASSGPLPVGADWAYELKWDGVRVLIDIQPDGMRMTSRTEKEVTTAYPELYGLAEECPDALLDGEIVAFSDGKPSFTALQPRMHVRNSEIARRLARSTPVTLLIFDVLRLYGVDLTDRPYTERRETLERIGLDGPQWMVPPSFDDGEATMQACTTQGLEGVVAKRRTSRYRPGTRTREWVKVKIRHRQEFVVGGWQRGTGYRSKSVGSLALGYYDDSGLRYVGQVGSGLTDRALRTLSETLAELVRDTPPFVDELSREELKDMVWCEPAVVVEVEYAEWTPLGRLRFPTYQGIRTDKDPRDVHRE